MSNITKLAILFIMYFWICVFFRVDILTLACGPHHVVTGGSAGVLFSWGCGANGRLGLGTEESQ